MAATKNYNAEAAEHAEKTRRKIGDTVNSYKSERKRRPLPFALAHRSDVCCLLCVFSAASPETWFAKQGRRPAPYQPGATPQVLGRFLFIGLKARSIWSGPSALLFCHSPILGRCPRLVWSAPSALGPMGHMEFLISITTNRRKSSALSSGDSFRRRLAAFCGASRRSRLRLC